MERLRDIVLPSGPVLPIYEDAGEGPSPQPYHASAGEITDRGSSQTRGNPKSMQSVEGESAIPLAEISPHSTQNHSDTTTSDTTPPATPSSQELPRKEGQSTSHRETSIAQERITTPASKTVDGDGMMEDSLRNTSEPEQVDEAAVVVPSTETSAITPSSTFTGLTPSAVVISTQTESAQVAPESTTTDPSTADRPIAESTARQQEAQLESEQRSSTVPAGDGTTTAHYVRDAQNEPPVGYPRLAERMACMPAASIFRSFAALNIQNLLHMQAEIECLEDQLLKVQAEDATTEENDQGRRWKYTRNWWMLQKSGSEDMDPDEHDDSIQWHITQKIQQKLQKYNEAVIQLMTILSANKPDIYDFNAIREYIESKEMEGGGALTGKDRFIYRAKSENDSTPLKDDLITLLPRAEPDRLTRWVIRWVRRRLYNEEERAQRRQRLDVAFEDDDIYRWTFVLTSGLAAVLPVVSMLALQSVEEVKVRKLSLVLIAVFNFVLAFLLTWLASVRRVEVFAVASAFAAVNVVFIGK